LLLGYAFIRTVLRTIIVNRFVKSHKESVLSMLVTPSQELKLSSVNIELNDADLVRPIMADDSSRMYLATFNFYRRTKSGTYLSKQAYYLVLETSLIRQLPHILFDSKSAKRNQFKSVYLKAQRISLEASFDDYFSTYTPQTYTIDTLSFISPEVMESLIEAKDYDIEILNDKLLMFAPLLDGVDRELFVLKGKALAAHINDNIDTYRDSRLSGEEKKTTVTPFARALLKSPAKQIMTVGLCAAIIVGIVLMTLVNDSLDRNTLLFNAYSITVYAILLSSAYSAWKIIRDNHRATVRFLEEYADKPIKTTIV
jgi:hypothetical protein